MKNITEAYRCSCCNEIKKPTNYAFMPFDSSLKKHSPIVAICRKCNFAIKKMGKKGVIQYLEAKSKRMKKNLLLVQ